MVQRQREEVTTAEVDYITAFGRTDEQVAVQGVDYPTLVQWAHTREDRLDIENGVDNTDIQRDIYNTNGVVLPRRLTSFLGMQRSTPWQRLSAKDVEDGPRIYGQINPYYDSEFTSGPLITQFDSLIVVEKGWVRLWGANYDSLALAYRHESTRSGLHSFPLVFATVSVEPDQIRNAAEVMRKAQSIGNPRLLPIGPVYDPNLVGCTEPHDPPAVVTRRENKPSPSLRVNLARVGAVDRGILHVPDVNGLVPLAPDLIYLINYNSYARANDVEVSFKESGKYGTRCLTIPSDLKPSHSADHLF